MVEKVIHKTKILYILSALVLAVAAVFAPVSSVFADNPQTLTFQVNIKEILKVTVTAPSSYASGDAGDFLTNKVNLSVYSNNNAGFTASMYADNTLNATACKNTSLAVNSLINCSKNTSSIATWGAYSTSSTTTSGAMAANKWGFSLNGTNYYGIPTSDNYWSYTRSSFSSSNYSQDFTFGAKANTSQDSGTYASTIVFNVVSGTTNTDNPVIPTNPATPSSDTPNDNKATYDSTNQRTVYNTTSGTTATAPSGTTPTTTITEVSSGDTRTSYANAQGVTTSSIGEGSPLALGLAVTAAAAAGTSIIFFIIAKRKKDDEEEDQQQMQ